MSRASTVTMLVVEGSTRPNRANVHPLNPSPNPASRTSDRKFVCGCLSNDPTIHFDAHLHALRRSVSVKCPPRCNAVTLPDDARSHIVEAEESGTGKEPGRVAKIDPLARSKVLRLYADFVFDARSNQTVELNIERGRPIDTNPGIQQVLPK